MSQPFSRRTALAALAAIAALPAAPVLSAGNPAGITGITWKAVEIAGEPLPEGVEADILIEQDGAAAGRGGCNRFATRATIDGNAIAFAPAAATRMMCHEAAMKVEHAFFLAIEATRGFAVEGDGAAMVLLDGEGGTLARFVPG